MINNGLLLEYFKVIHRDLNKVEFRLDAKNRIYIPLLSSSIDHCISIYVLNKQYLASSMYALIRPTVENYLRAMWVKYCVDDSAMDDDLSTMHFPKKLEYLIEQVDQKIPDFKKSNFLKTRLEPLIKNIHDFTHGGIQSIARQYSGEQLLSNMRNKDEIKSILKLTVLISLLSYDEIVHDSIGGDSLESERVHDLAMKIIEL